MSYRKIKSGRIVVFGEQITRGDKLVQVYHWKRLTWNPDEPDSPENGIQVDGSGPARAGVESKKNLVADLKKRFPDDVFEGA